MKKRLSLTLLAGLVAGLLGLPKGGLGDEQAELAEIRAKMRVLEQRLSKQSVERDQVGAALRKVETQMGESSKQLLELATQHRQLTTEKAALAEATTASRGRLASQRAALAEQLRMNYMVGRQENLKLLLNQDSPARLGRMLVYYDYLNAARSERIEGFNAELNKFARLEDDNNRVLREIETLQAQQEQALRGLQQAREDRSTVLVRLNSELQQAGGELKRLTAEEAELRQLVEELSALLAEFPAESSQRFSAVRGQLGWPVAGRLLNDYGQLRAGNLRWNGVLVGADSGTNVRALYYGRVVFADWLAGMGLLLVIEHGEGYMSLYGHNEALLKEAGDWVAPGERVALVGDSGGRGTPGLYFEIRRAGEPQNPHRWIKKRLASH
jgi:septal ring factor EnvC (AmiA/AmiB activator)